MYKYMYTNICLHIHRYTKIHTRVEIYIWMHLTFVTVCSTLRYVELCTSFGLFWSSAYLWHQDDVLRLRAVTIQHDGWTVSTDMGCLRQVLTWLGWSKCGHDNSISVDAMTSVVESLHRSSHIRNVAQRSSQIGTMLTIGIIEYSTWINGTYDLLNWEKTRDASGKTCRCFLDTSIHHFHTSGIQTIIDSYHYGNPCAISRWKLMDLFVCDLPVFWKGFS